MLLLNLIPLLKDLLLWRRTFPHANVQNRYSLFFTKQNRFSLINSVQYFGGKDPCRLLWRLWPWTESCRRAKKYTEWFPKIISILQTIWRLEPFRARYSLYVFNNNQCIYFALICPAQHGAVQSFVICSVLQSGMGEHVPKPHGP